MVIKVPPFHGVIIFAVSSSESSVSIAQPH